MILRQMMNALKRKFNMEVHDMLRKYLAIMAVVLIAAFAAGIQAKGTTEGTVITNATTAGGIPVFAVSTNPGNLAGQFTNDSGSVFNADLSLATIATTYVSVGYDLSVLLPVTDTLASGAGSTVSFVYEVTNWGNMSDDINLAVSNIGASAGWMAALPFGIQTNGDNGPQTQNYINITKTGLSVGGVLQITVQVTIPAAQADGDTNHLVLHVRNSAAPAGDTWPGVNAIAPATSDVANARDWQTIDLYVNVSGPVLMLSKTVDLNAARPYEDLTYTIKYTNTGSADALDVVIRDVLPSDTVIVSGSLQINHNNGGYVVLTDAIDGDEAETNSISGAKTVSFSPNGGTIPTGIGGRLQFTVRVK